MAGDGTMARTWPVNYKMERAAAAGRRSDRGRGALP